jgi:CDP-diacylglycerol pyrophosphatase
MPNYAHTLSTLRFKGSGSWANEPQKAQTHAFAALKVIRTATAKANLFQLIQQKYPLKTISSKLQGPLADAVCLHISS